MVMKRCDQGHDYDAGIHTMFPVCGSGVPYNNVANIESNEDIFTWN